jgi:3'(2'), 5'-bisphosphate nucleotidase
MTEPSRDPELEEVLRIARRAAAVVRDVYQTAFEVELKAPGDPVTRADREANDLICRALETSFPTDAVLAEESVPSDAGTIAALTSRRRVFYVDPLDGTREFVERVDEQFAVMIGLAVDGRAALGVVVQPIRDEALVGRVGGTAFLETKDGTRRPLAVSTCAEPHETRLVVSRSHRPRLVQPVVDALGIRTVIPCGSVGMKVAKIASGAADVYLHGGTGVKKWDTCGPEAILFAAGGRFTDLDGKPIAYDEPEIGQRGGIVASNGRLHDVVLSAIERARESQQKK